MGHDAPMRRRDKEIADRTEIERIIDAASVLRVAMVDAGQPYVVPMNFAREGSDIWLHSALTGRKVDCLRADGRVCIEVDHFTSLKTGPSACDDWSSSYESVIGFGRAEIVEDSTEKIRGLKALMRKYSGRDDWSFDGLPTTAVIRVRLESVTGKRSPIAG
ncbi:MAG: pyridoxamine 5'-phosphate oxidase family protein [Actinobacteria bacterium]|nr:pyridoxamine 5'-phosphate oxidase family protein [Actinomycetota bacterium]